MKRSFAFGFAVLLATLSLAAAAEAQSCGALVTGNPAQCVLRVNLPTAKIAQLRLNTASTTFSAAGLAELTAGEMDATGPTFSVKANLPFQVQVNAAAGTFDGGSGSKPPSDLLWRLASGGSYAAMGGSPATLYTSATGAHIADGILYRLLLSFGADTPGTYELPVIFTLSAP